jgi:DNA-binding MarR family transcriptional regulator
VGPDDLRSTLGRIQAIRHACDLDLLLFFYRHPRALLTSEQLVAYLGYDAERVAKSLDGMIEAGLLTRSQYPSNAARMYALELRGPDGALLASLLQVAATQQGRRDLMRLLEAGPNSLRLLRRSGDGHA